MNPGSISEELRRQLRKRGISRAYAERYVGELRDHLEDLRLELTSDGIADEEAQRRATVRLGSVEMLAEAAVQGYRRQAFIGRHPCVFFAMLPLLFTPIVLALLFMLSLLPLLPYSHDGRLSEGAQGWTSIACAVSNYGFPGLLAVIGYRTARRRALGRRWQIIAAAWPIAWGAWIHSTFFKGGHRATVGIGAYPWPSSKQFAAALAILLIYLWLVRRGMRRELSIADR